MEPICIGPAQDVPECIDLTQDVSECVDLTQDGCECIDLTQDDVSQEVPAPRDPLAGLVVNVTERPDHWWTPQPSAGYIPADVCALKRMLNPARTRKETWSPTYRTEALALHVWLAQSAIARARVLAAHLRMHGAPVPAWPRWLVRTNVVLNAAVGAHYLQMPTIASGVVPDNLIAPFLVATASPLVRQLVDIVKWGVPAEVLPHDPSYHTHCGTTCAFKG